MVTRYGFSPLGPVSLEGEGAEVFLGRDWLRSEPHYSQETGNRIDAQVQQLARVSLQKAVELLKPRRELMDALVNLLIQRETIEGAEFAVLVKRHEEQAMAAAQAAAAV
jgi:cell division protease FtsH